MSLQSLELEWEDSNSGFVQLLVSLSSCCCGLGHTFPCRDTGEAPGAHCSCGSQALWLQGQQPAGTLRGRGGGRKALERMELQLLSASRHEVRTYPGGTSPPSWASALVAAAPLFFSKNFQVQQKEELEMGLYSNEMPQSSIFHSF